MSNNKTLELWTEWETRVRKETMNSVENQALSGLTVFRYCSVCTTTQTNRVWGPWFVQSWQWRKHKMIDLLHSLIFLESGMRWVFRRWASFFFISGLMVTFFKTVVFGAFIFGIRNFREISENAKIKTTDLVVILVVILVAYLVSKFYNIF